MEINEQKLKDILNEQRKEYQTYLGVLNEDFTDQVKLIAESISGTQEQLIAIRDMVVKNTEDIEMIKIEIFGVKREVVEIKKDIAITKTDIEIIKQNLRVKVDIQEFEALEKRVAILEAGR